jgi:hypothetical protein
MAGFCEVFSGLERFAMKVQEIPGFARLSLEK